VTDKPAAFPLLAAPLTTPNPLEKLSRFHKAE
jgi:hypothetical protein